MKDTIYMKQDEEGNYIVDEDKTLLYENLCKIEDCETPNCPDKNCPGNRMNIRGIKYNLTGNSSPIFIGGIDYCGPLTQRDKQEEEYK